MWHEKLELIDDICEVNCFDDWVLKYQISEASLDVLSLLGLYGN